MKSFFISYAFVVVMLLIICFAHFIDAVGAHDWHTFLYGLLTLLLAVAFILLLVGG